MVHSQEDFDQSFALPGAPYSKFLLDADHKDGSALDRQSRDTH